MTQTRTMPVETFSIAPMVHILSQLAELVRMLPSEVYTGRPELLQCGTIGGHVRHSVDHVFAVLKTVESGGQIVDYDARERETPIELQPGIAASALEEACVALEALDESVLGRRVQGCLGMTSSGARVSFDADVKRELGFVFSHTVHHMAIIGMLARFQGVEVPAGFGLAPSTQAFRDGHSTVE